MDGRILVATDGTAEALGALRVAAALAERDGRAPIVVSVVEPIVLEGSVLYAIPGQVLAFSDQPEAEVCDRVAAQLRALGAPAANWAPEVEIGPVAPTIARLAEERGARLIVLGRGRHTRVERFLGGETALDVVRLARVPVLAVDSAATGLPRRAVAAVDFSDYGRDAVRTLLDMLADGAEVRLAHVEWTRGGDEHDPEAWTTTYRAGVQARLEELTAGMDARPGVCVSTEVLDGFPSRELLALAERVGADVIAAGSHGHGFLTRLVMGSVSTRLLREARCSVLIAPPRAASAELRQARTSRAAAPAEVRAGA